MKVLVTGTNGYIGCVLGPYLMQRGIEVVGLDTGYYRDGWLYSDDQATPRTPLTINKDLRQVDAAHVGTRDGHGADLRLDKTGRELTKTKTGGI